MLLLALAAGLGVTTLALVGVSAGSTGHLRVTALSARPGSVTGRDVLLGVKPASASARFTVGGHRLETTQDADGHWLVLGLHRGRQRIDVQTSTGRGSLVVVDHPTGPVFSGPHVPLLCTATTPPASRASASATCAAPTTDELLPASATRPPVRIRRGVVNRSPYSFAWPVSGWNHRLVYEFGGGCGTAYSQGTPLGTDVLDDALLAKGYAVATANFNTFRTSCNDVLSAETAMMIKELVAEVIGVPRFTIGAGASGGAIQQLMIAQNYPGILDALSPVVPFPDAITTASGFTDCGLLDHYYATGAGGALTDGQRAAINGHRTTGTCRFWVSSFLDTIDPTVGCDSRIPKDQVYSAVNRRGIRCTLQDYGRNLFGVDPRTGYARRPLDNVGVQYGLRALQRGTITVEQFLDLNEKIGGYDVDGRFVAARERARREDVRRAYETGRVLSGGGSLRDIPIITVNLYSDPYGDIHDRFRLFSIRERLRDEHGKVDANETIWTRASSGDIDPAAVIGILDQWLTTGTRPAEAVDNCTDAAGTVVSGDHIYDRPGPCRDLYPIFGDPRTAAGASLVDDVIKCALRPVAAKAYKVAFTSSQLARLRWIFPTGVCDWKARGVGQAPLAATWIDYGTGRFKAAGI